jgi:hypothetical protein
MTSPLEPINLDDPVVSKQPQPTGKTHPPPTKPPATPEPLPGKIHPTPVPLTFAETFGAVFLAILAAAAVIWFVVMIANVRQEHEKLDKELKEIHQRAQRP